MKIGIVGCGAIGLLFASYLSSDHDVTLYTRRIDQLKDLKEYGLTLIQNDKKTHCFINVKHISEGFENQEIVIIAVKQYDLQTLIKENSFDTIPALLFLQNGMGHIEQLERLNNKLIYLGIVEHGALKSCDTTVLHKGIGKTKISSYRGSMAVCHQVFKQENPQFPVLFEKNWYTMLISKLLVNAVVNPLTALFRVSNGEIIQNEQFNLITKQLFNEVASALKIQNQSLAWENIIEVCRNTAENRSSMLKDIEAGRKTEIDSILGYIIGQAVESSLPVTTFVFRAIKGLENGSRE